MNSFDFREIMIKKVRAFENWAWKDCNENPQDWTETNSLKPWWALFKDYVEDDING